MKALLLSITLVATGLSLVGCGQKSDNTPSSSKGTNASATSGNPLDAPAEYLGGLAKGQRNAVKTVDTSSLNQAIQLFNVDKGRNPTDLNELVKEKYIPMIPAAPYGMKLEYNASAGT